MTGNNVFSGILQIVCNVFDSYSAVLFLPDGAGGCVLAESFSLGDHVRRGMALPPGQGLAGWIVKEKKPLLLSNFDQKRGVLGYYLGNAESEIRAFLGVPLPGLDGALCLDSKKVHGFGDKDQKILAQFAALAASLHLERRGLVQSHAEAAVSRCLLDLPGLPRRHPKWLPYLTALLGVVSGASGFSHCFLAVRDDEAQAFGVEGSTRPLSSDARLEEAAHPLGGGMIGWVFKNDAPVYAPDSETTALRLFGSAGGAAVFRSVVCQPVHFSGRTRAVLVLASPEGAILGEIHKDFARAVADQLALFLENLHLKARLSKPKA
jgi:GAF domain-containing protein